MTSRAIRLRHLVRITEIIYRQKAVDVARARLAFDEIGQTREATVSWLGTEAAASMLAEVALRRAVRLREGLGEADDALRAELEAAVSALGCLKGVEGRLAREVRHRREAEDRHVLDDLLERMGGGGGVTSSTQAPAPIRGLKSRQSDPSNQSSKRKT